MDELILSRLAPGLYATTAATESAGLAFVPETDPGLASLALSGDVTEEGRWLAWSHGPLLPVLSQVVPLLRVGDRRIVFPRTVCRCSPACQQEPRGDFGQQQFRGPPDA